MLLLLLLINQAIGVEYFVYPEDQTSPCARVNGCRSISYYVSNSSEYFVDDSIFYFLEGTHVIKTASVIEISDVSNLTFQGIGKTNYSNFEVSTVRIECFTSSGGLSFVNCSDISVRGISFSGCGGRVSLPFAFASANVSLSFNEVYNVNLESISVINTPGLGLALTNCYDIVLLNSSFSRNEIMESCLYTDVLCTGGNVLIHHYILPSEMESKDFTNITIMNCDFFYGFTSLLGMSGGLTISYGIDLPLYVLYDTLLSYGNTGITGGNYRFTAFTNADYTLVFRNIFGFNGNNYHSFTSEITESVQVNSAGFSFVDSTVQDTETRAVSISFYGCEFSNGIALSYGGLSFYWMVDNVENIKVSIQDCIFRNNTGLHGSGLFTTSYRALFSSNLLISLKDIIFDDNKGGEVADQFNSAVFLQNVYAQVDNVSIINSQLTGMILIGTIMSIKGNNLFYNNSGINGGGLAMYESSVLLFSPPVNIFFIDNFASRQGGGMFVDRVQYTGDTGCFYGFLNGSYLVQYARVEFNGNRAGIAGDVLYGGNIINCNSRVNFFRLFQFPNQTGISAFASHPYQVCFCNNRSEPDCFTDEQYSTTFPGQSFSISLIVVGLAGGAVPGIIRITDFTNEPEVTVLRSLRAECNNISYAIKLSNTTQVSSTVYFSLQREENPAELDNTKDLFLSILPCPAGFQLDIVTGLCTCIGELDNVRTVVCDVTTEEMSREGSVWMGYNAVDNCTIVREDCPYDYCITDNVTFHITEPDPQCALNRAGTMCGACAEGYSLMLGTNKCGKCSNISILLIVVFILAGAALVLVIVVLNMTLSLGVINGLIFYGNIIKINEDIFFPQGPIPVLSQYISWINLDFGIEACFYDGMTALAKAWLHFVFPIYIWILVIIIIVLAHYSKRIAKLIGSNSVPILATLILLSYAKLFRAVVNALVGTFIFCGSNTVQAWYVDPNIEYNNPSHLTLVVLASFVLFALCLPYTIILLFNQLLIVCLASNVSVKIGFSSIRLGLRLFLDAYNAPYKLQWRFWTGLLLLVRFISVLIISLDSKANVLLSTTVMLAIVLSIFAISGGVYKASYLNYLEVWFMFNLFFVISMVTGDDLHTQIASGISAGATLITFIGIIIFHFWLKIADTAFGSKLKVKVSKLYKPRKEESSERDYTESGDFSGHLSVSKRSTSIGVDLRRRETLLYPLVESTNTTINSSSTVTL